MNTEDRHENANVEKLLRRQRPPASNEPVPALPDALRQQWSAHFKPQGTGIRRPFRVWATGLAAAAATIAAIEFLWFDGGPPKRDSAAQHPTADIAAGLRAIAADDDWAATLSPIGQALLHYHDPATAGLYVRE